MPAQMMNEIKQNYLYLFYYHFYLILFYFITIKKILLPFSVIKFLQNENGRESKLGDNEHAGCM